MNEIRSPSAEAFSLMRGGALRRLLVSLRQDETERQRVVLRAAFAAAVTWIPLLALSLAQGVAFGARVEIPFLHDFSVSLRLLVALPILILAESTVDGQWRQNVCEFVRRRLVGPAELPAFEGVIAGVIRLRDRLLPEAVLGVLALLPSLVVDRVELLSVSNWHSLGAGRSEPSLAGLWFVLVSAPVFRFLFLRWLWRMLLYALFLRRVSRLRLDLVATHTDMAAGLGFLGEGQRAFSAIVFAGGTVIAGQVSNAIVYEGATLASLRYHMLAYAVIALVLLAAPLLSVSPLLREVKKAALFEYGALVTRHDQLFAARWIRGERAPGTEILGSPDASSLSDLGAGFSVVRDMTVVPLDKRTFLALAGAAALPMLPVLVFATPTNELIGAVLRMLG